MREMRDVHQNPTPLDRASLYVESLKYGGGAGKVRAAGWDETVGQMETLLRDAGVRSMTGAELLEALEFYERSLVRGLCAPLLLVRSCFLDGLMHGIALAGGLEGQRRDPKTGAVIQ